MNLDKKLGLTSYNYLENLICFKIICKKRMFEIKSKSSNLNEYQHSLELSDINDKYDKIYIKLIEQINSKMKNESLKDDFDFLNKINHQINMIELIYETVISHIFEEIILNGWYIIHKNNYKIVLSK